ncbi:outer membrane family protein [Helicobacter fennelliae]|uniref:Outer membrane protein n=1 Tax=Helicobacter fennelliae TaxID=215 RepID=A0A2X3BFC4_9HELI|nr:outer membrane family protein [Helicobacter fennelliae]SQB98494.1 Uncharacterised protein [Helicobacter fennelliae]STP07857.1 Uncharacterised protein [Helicobacter fennelliae]STQ84258.1 Uncharacterised protein [Helicobacter fennelliae]
MLRKLIFVFVSVALMLYGANQPTKLNDAPANSFADAFKRGLVYGHAGLLFQQSIKDSPTYGDINLSLGYESRRYMGYKFGAEAWLIPKLYEGNKGDFTRGQMYFDMPQLYADYYNQYEKFGGTVGRYRINEEWMTNYSEGLSANYDRFNNIRLSFAWALRNAYITNYFSRNFEVFGSYINAKWTGGAFNFKAEITIPQAPLVITPYVYLVPDFFIAPGLKGDLSIPINNKISLHALIHLMSYVELNEQRKALNNNGGGIIWLEGSADLAGFRFGGGIVNVPAGGATYIDAFGQHTPFERSDGIFYYNSTTPYAFVSANFWNYVTAYGAFRISFINGRNVLNWEGKVDIMPIPNIRMGLAAIGMDNKADAPSRFGGKDYMIFRGYVEYSF